MNLNHVQETSLALCFHCSFKMRSVLKPIYMKNKRWNLRLTISDPNYNKCVSYSFWKQGISFYQFLGWDGFLENTTCPWSTSPQQQSLQGAFKSYAKDPTILYRNLNIHTTPCEESLWRHWKVQFPFNKKKPPEQPGFREGRPSVITSSNRWTMLFLDCTFQTCSYIRIHRCVWVLSLCAKGSLWHMMDGIWVTAYSNFTALWQSKWKFLKKNLPWILIHVLYFMSALVMNVKFTPGSQAAGSPTHALLWSSRRKVSMSCKCVGVRNIRMNGWKLTAGYSYVNTFWYMNGGRTVGSVCVYNSTILLAAKISIVTVSTAVCWG